MYFSSGFSYFILSFKPYFVVGYGNLGMGSANFMEMQQRMQRELLNNPDMLRQVMDNPLTQSLMSNPDVIRQMLESNPQMQEVMDRNPEIRQMLNNPEVLRQMMEIARNPSRLQEMTRTMDRQMQNLEAMPGGMNILQRMYRDVQEPVLNAMGGPNPFQDLRGNQATPSEVPSTETSQPAPNPWAAQQPQQGAGECFIFISARYVRTLFVTVQVNLQPRRQPPAPGPRWADSWGRARACSPRRGCRA